MRKSHFGKSNPKWLFRIMCQLTRPSKGISTMLGGPGMLGCTGVSSLDHQKGFLLSTLQSVFDYVSSVSSLDHQKGFLHDIFHFRPHATDHVSAHSTIKRDFYCKV